METVFEMIAMELYAQCTSFFFYSFSIVVVITIIITVIIYCATISNKQVNIGGNCSLFVEKLFLATNIVLFFQIVAHFKMFAPEDWRSFSMLL